jgi:hypothetical protein
MNYRNQSFNNYNKSFNKKPGSKLPIIGAALLLVVSIVVAVYFFFFKKEPIDCVGDWKKGTLCPVDCGLSASKVTETYSVTTPMEHGGKQCDFADGYIKDIDCPETESCKEPVDCVGYWKKNAECPVDCGHLASKVTETYSVTTPMEHGGTSCAFADGDIKYIDCPEPELCNGPEYDSTSTYPGTSLDNFKKYCDEMLRKGYCKYENIRENNCRNECNPR